MKNYYDVIIIGAGPAGISCARELEKSDISVLLLEKQGEIRSKVCAGGLTSKINKTFLKLEQADILFKQVKLNIDNRQKTITDSEPFVGTISRAKLSATMQKTLTSKTDVRLNCQVIKITDDFIETNKGEQIKYQHLVGADGSASIVRRYVGLKQKRVALACQYKIPKKLNELEIFFEPKFFGSGYAWIFPHLNHTLIGCVSSQEKHKQNLVKNFHLWLTKQNINTNGLALEAGTINFDYQDFSFGNKFLIGDAAGFASGLTGEGIYFAIVSGTEVAKKIINPHYQYPQIKEILYIKKRHDQVLSVLNFLTAINPLFAELCAKSLMPLITIPLFRKKLIMSFS